jgi:predicted MPP superfamily phosphohydrolase
VKLQLSGHTHGGQIIGMDQLVKRANGGFVSGRYDVEG